MKYVNRDEIIKAVKEAMYPMDYPSELRDSIARTIVSAAESIDIVLCKNCKYFVPRTDHTGLCGWHKSMGHNVGVAVNDYCSFGGREEQGDE